MPRGSEKQQRRKGTLNHLSRIEGQLAVLKRYIAEDRECQEIAQLTASITASFETLKLRTLEGYIRHELVGKKLADAKQVELTKILKLYKK